MAIAAAVLLLIAAVSATVFGRTRHSPAGALSAADARAAMRAVHLRDIGSGSTAGQTGPIGTECPARLHGAIGSTADGAFQVSIWVCDSAAHAQGIAAGFPASMPGLSDVDVGRRRLPGIDVSAQDNMLVWVAASQPSLAYETAEHLRELLGGQAGRPS
jgi:hypothetical protein